MLLVLVVGVSRMREAQLREMLARATGASLSSLVISFGVFPGAQSLKLSYLFSGINPCAG